MEQLQFCTVIFIVLFVLQVELSLGDNPNKIKYTLYPCVICDVCKKEDVEKINSCYDELSKDTRQTVIGGIPECKRSGANLTADTPFDSVLKPFYCEGSQNPCYSKLIQTFFDGSLFPDGIRQKNIKKDFQKSKACLMSYYEDCNKRGKKRC